MALLVASIVAGVALALAIAGYGLVALAGLVVFVLVETCVVLDLLGFRPEDLA